MVRSAATPRVSNHEAAMSDRDFDQPESAFVISESTIRLMSPSNSMPQNAPPW